ncbi:nitroreductase/quinone reductase family protein [Amycolatopsis sp. cg5]|uniref:nitroreductase/quinone reductase family protein n=1 Tax=Amycolatopsis sp. cg5 TaxID=3238802 RepID=UPI0035266449
MDTRSLNAEMTERLLAAPAEPVPDGGYALRVLETRGRTSAEPRRTPLAVVGREGGHFLVSPVRGRDWVRNLLADPACAVLENTDRIPCQAHEVVGAEAAAVIAVYLRSMTVPWAIRAFPVPQEASLDDILGHVADMAVFELRDRP